MKKKLEINKAIILIIEGDSTKKRVLYLADIPQEINSRFWFSADPENAMQFDIDKTTSNKTVSEVMRDYRKIYGEHDKIFYLGFIPSSQKEAKDAIKSIIFGD